MTYNDKPTTTQYVLAVICGLIIAAIFVFCFGNIAFALGELGKHLPK